MRKTPLQWGVFLMSDNCMKRIKYNLARYKIAPKKIHLTSSIEKASKISKKVKVVAGAFQNKANLVKGYALNPRAPIALVFNVAPWKREYVRNFFPEYKIKFVALNESLDKYESLVSLFNVIIVVWGRSVLGHVSLFSNRFNIPIYHIEDGFIRSMGLGAEHIAPMSLCIDKHGLYYDANQPSDLEILLNSYDFKSDPKLMERASNALNTIKKYNITKYNLGDTNYATNIYGPKLKNKSRILVVGQVEDDQSLIYGCERVFSNLDLLKIAINENPDAQIIYKPHPDVMFAKRAELSDISSIAEKIETLNVNLSMVDALSEVDRVYTMTSLAGFEALIYGVPVTTVGAPFYSGWGLTDDRRLIKRRKRKLSLLEVFAAAYILYPRYRTNGTLSESSIEDSIDVIASNKVANSYTPELGNTFSYLKFHNLHTTNRVNNKLITNLHFENLVVLSDSKDSLSIAEDIANQSNMKVSLVTTRDTLANDQEMIGKSSVVNKKSRVEISSIHKKYSVPLSTMELKTVNLSERLSKALEDVLDQYFGQFLSPNLIKQLSLGLADYCYFDVLRFLSMKKLLDDYDVVVLRLEDYKKNLDVIQAIKYYAEKTGKSNKVFVSIEDMKLSGLFSNNTISIKDYRSSDDSNSIRDAASFWYDINDLKYHQKDEVNKVLVCGNIHENNYAYSPATKRVLGLIKKNDTQGLFVNSNVTNDKYINEYKSEILASDLYSNIDVYRITKSNFVEIYGEKLNNRQGLFSVAIKNNTIFNASKFMPLELLSCLESRIETYCSGLQTLLCFISDIERRSSNISVFYTTMERSLISRVITEILNEKGVKTVGIQPQIISSSKRYSKPLVTDMGVIDSRQEGIMTKMGYRPENIKRVGSINISERLELMETHSSIEKTYDVFFAMQHSASDVMISTIKALKDICNKHNLSLIVKPHPHQELPLINIVRQELGSMDNVIVLGKDSETYEWIVKCKLVVGLFSSVLLESAIFGQNVVIAYGQDLDESVDLSKIGLALRTDTKNELEETILDFISGGNRLSQLEKSRRSYLDNNLQFSTPYNGRCFDSFVESYL